MVDRLDVPAPSVTLYSAIIEITGMNKRRARLEHDGAAKEKRAYCTKKKKPKTVVGIT